VRDGIHVRYVGPGVREVPGVGVFQTGTVAWVPRAIALEILREDVFVAEGTGKPASALVIRIGQKASHEENPRPARASEPAPASAALEIAPEDLAARLAAGEPTLLVDVREPWEHEHCALDDSTLAPVSGPDPDAGAISLLDLAPPEGALVVCYCHHGVRSLAAVRLLRERKVAPGAVSLRGGIDLWSRRVDPSVPRY
jgi:adenylyltransferase/sulfurtransferase